MRVEEAFLSLSRKGHHERFARIAQAHHKDLDGLANTANDGYCLPPIALRVLAWFIDQGKKKIRGLMVFLPLRNIPSDP